MKHTPTDKPLDQLRPAQTPPAPGTDDPEPAMPLIKRNAIQCKNCGDVIESTHRHHYVTCSCGECSVDGGRDYLRVSCRTKDSFVPLFEFED